MLNEGDIQNKLRLGVPRTGLRTTGLEHNNKKKKKIKLKKKTYIYYSMSFVDDTKTQFF